jgi:hypothetical protein
MKAIIKFLKVVFEVIVETRELQVESMKKHGHLGSWR